MLHYTDLSELACSPYQCDFKTNFRTFAVHEPYLHRKIEWGNFLDPLAIVDKAKLVGIAGIPALITIGGMATVISACLTPLACLVGIAAMSPAVVAGVVGTYYLGNGALEFFLHEFTELTP